MIETVETPLIFNFQSILTNIEIWGTKKKSISLQKQTNKKGVCVYVVGGGGGGGPYLDHWKKCLTNYFFSLSLKNFTV